MSDLDDLLIDENGDLVMIDADGAARVLARALESCWRDHVTISDLAELLAELAAPEDRQAIVDRIMSIAVRSFVAMAEITPPIDEARLELEGGVLGLTYRYTALIHQLAFSHTVKL